MEIQTIIVRYYQIWYFHLLASVVASLNSTPWVYNGTTPGLQSLILGRCYEFKEFNHLNRLKDFSVDVPCRKVWEAFKKSFAHKDICSIEESDYDPFFNLLRSNSTTKDLLFWSGTRTIAHDFTHVSDHYVTLEDTFPGYIANQLRWCGSKGNGTEGIDFRYCNQSCPNTAYWSRASYNLARKANGVAHVLLNGTGRGINTAYYRGSFFGRVELPTLGRLKKIRKLVVLVAHDLDVQPKEKCGQGTLVELTKDAKQYGIDVVECHDDPVSVLGILCAKSPHSPQCRRSKWRWTLLTLVFVCLSSLLFVILIGLIIWLLRQRRKVKGTGGERLRVLGNGTEQVT